REAPESADLDALSRAERVRHRLEDAVHHLLCTALGDVRSLRDSVDELGLGHGAENGPASISTPRCGSMAVAGAAPGATAASPGSLRLPCGDAPARGARS